MSSVTSPKAASRSEALLGVSVPQSLVVPRVRESTLVPRLLSVKVKASAPHSGMATKLTLHTASLRRLASLLLLIGALLPPLQIRLSSRARPHRSRRNSPKALSLTLPVAQALLQPLTSRRVQSLVVDPRLLASLLFSLAKWVLIVVRARRALSAPRVIQLSIMVALLALVLAATAVPRKDPIPSVLRLEFVSRVVRRQVLHRVSRHKLSAILKLLTPFMALGAENI